MIKNKEAEKYLKDQVKEIMEPLIANMIKDQPLDPVILYNII